MRQALRLQLILVALGMAGTAFQAEAATITISPSTAWCTADLDNPDPCTLETGGQNPKPGDFPDYMAANYGVNQLYKSNHQTGTGGLGSDEGPAAGWYNTQFSNETEDPANALISWNLGAHITGPIYLLVRDGNVATPIWYLFRINNWNGQDELKMENFWAGAPGAISHVAIYGSSTSVPDGGSAAALLGSALLAVSLLRRRFDKRPRS